MSQCASPGCPGQVEDGYCNVCGLAPAPPNVPVPRPPPGLAGTPGTHDRLLTGNPPGSAPPVPGGGLGGAAGNGPGGAVGSGPGGGLSAGLSTAPSTAPGLLAAGASGATYSGPLGSTRSARRGMLGAGLVDVPPVPYRDPATAVLENPEVAEKRRFCSSCGKPVGRSRNERPGRTEGFCPHCGTGFSFTPKLWPGDMVSGQYEVLGCLAHGGLGWIYLARDRNVSHRWVVLKGLLDTGDAAAMASAATERAFLAEVEHPNIVKIYNFVQHPDPRTQTMVGYIVMEYVGGRSLKDIVLEYRRGGPDGVDFPLGQVLAYGLEALRALGYLHSKGLLFCDFKPDNAIQSEEQLKLIDLGGVRRMADADSPIYGTVGYQAPEIGDDGPSVSSDLYTVGRTLAVLSFQFRGFTGDYAATLPPREQVPVLSRHESYDRLLRRATHPDPGARFADAEEMAMQLTGVLREVLATEDGQERPAHSALFGPERQAAGTQLAEPGDPRPVNGDGSFRGLDPVAAAAALPVPGGYGSDPAADLTGEDLDTMVAALSTIQTPTVEDRLLEVRVRIARGEVVRAAELLDGVDGPDQLGWRADWYRGLIALAGARFEEARTRFDGIYSLMPGEAAPKLAIAFCVEALAERESAVGHRAAATRHRAAAAHYYELVWRTDRSYVSAAFGLARVHLAAGDRQRATEVLDSVPKTSSYRIDAQIAAVAAAVRGRQPDRLSAADLVAAGNRLQDLGLDAERYGQLAAELLEAALAWRLVAPRTGGGARAALLLGRELIEDEMRRGLEHIYRELARHADDADDRDTLINRANAVRPKTLL